MPDSQESSTDNRPQKNAECASDRWTPAVFLDKAQELKRRLAVWQFDDAEEPEWIETFLKSQEVIRWTFRDVIFKGENGPRPKPSRQYLDGLASKVNEAAGMVGTVFRNLPTDANKHLTRWLLRDFYEHLPDAGNGARAQFLKLKVDRILDAQMYCTRELKEGDDLYTDEESGGKGDERPNWLIDGHPVEPTLLDEFIEAVQALWQASADAIDAQCARQQLDFTYPFEFVAVSRTSDIANSLIGVANRLYERMLKWNYPEDVDWDDSSPEFHERQNQRYFFTFERPLHEDFQQHDFDQARVWLKINAPVVYEEIEGAVANLETRMPLAATANMDACNDLATDFAKVAFELVRVAHEIVRYERGNEGSKEAWSGQQPKPATATGERIISSSDIADLARRAILELSSLISGTGFTEDDIPHFDFGIPAYDAVSELLACDGQRFLLEEKVEVNFTGDPLNDPWWEVLRATRKGKCLSGMTKEQAIMELVAFLEEKYLREDKPGTRRQNQESKPHADSSVSISVASWKDLAIGIDEKGSFWAVTPVPNFQSVFPKDSAVQLPLKGDRWKELLKLLAMSDDGCTARKKDLFVAFRYRSQPIKDEDIDEIRLDSGEMNEIKSVNQRLTQAMGDLGRELRKQVHASDYEKRRNPPLSTADKKYVVAGFTCRHLCPDSNGKLCFGRRTIG